MRYNPKDISVIICGYTEERWTAINEAIESVLLQNPREIIFVCDHNANLLERVRERFPTIIAIPNEGEQGASDARNTGVAKSTGSILAFLDDDVIVDRKWMETVCAAHEDEKVIGISGKTIPLWLGEEPKWYPEEFYWIFGCTHRGSPTEKTPVRNAWTCNMTVRRDVFDSINGFRTGFGKVKERSSPEDTEFCIRANQAWRGQYWLYEPTAIVQHKVPDTRTGWKYFRWRCYNEGFGKAELTGILGNDEGMTNERSYAATTLPIGVLRNLAIGIIHFDVNALKKSVAIVAGALLVTTGYARGTLKVRRQESTPSTAPIS